MNGHCEWGRTGRTCGEVVRLWRSRPICGSCLGYWRDDLKIPKLAPINAAQAMKMFQVMAQNFKGLSYEEYLYEVTNALVNYPSWRIGQGYFNVLDRYRPDLAGKVCGTDLDPFYQDEVIEKFCSWVKEKW